MRELRERDKQLIIDSIPDTSLVLFLPALHGRGGTMIDRSQSGNNGTINGATWKRMPRGLKYLYFDGTNDTVSVSDAVSLNFDNYIAVEAWIYMAEAPAAFDPIVDHGVFPDTGFSFGVDSARKGKLAFNNTVGWVNHDGPTIPLTTWCYFRASYDGSNVTYDLNGTITTVAELNGYNGTLVGKGLYIGNSWALIANRYWKGNIAMVRLYNAAQTVSRHARERHLFGV